jgi:Transglycosylase SLT domain
MKALLYSSILGAIAFIGIDRAFVEKTTDPAPLNALASASLNANVIASANADVPSTSSIGAVPVSLPREEASLTAEQPAIVDLPEKDQSRFEQEDDAAPSGREANATPPKSDLSYLVYYAYSEIPPEVKPADIVRNSLKDVPLGTPVEEIKRVSDAFSLDFSFMKAVAKVESGFDPKQRTGSYIGLFQLSRYEFGKYGSGDILNPRDNAIAAAYKILTENVLFEWEAHKKPTFSDMYLIHQQGWQGATEHINHLDQVAWKSMCGTDEGHEKGEKWCKRAIWGNTLPEIKKAWKSVEKLTSAAFVDMWRQRIEGLYSRYAEAAAADTKQASAGDIKQASAGDTKH